MIKYGSNCHLITDEKDKWVFLCCTEISTRSDVKVEGDKRLDKLESFLDKLHNKGTLSLLLIIVHSIEFDDILHNRIVHDYTESVKMCHSKVKI